MRTIRLVIHIGPVPEDMAVGFVKTQQADTGEHRQGSNAVMVDGILRSVLRGLDKGQRENLNAVGPFAEVMSWVSILGLIISNPGSTITAQVIDPDSSRPSGNPITFLE